MTVDGQLRLRNLVALQMQAAIPSLHPSTPNLDPPLPAQRQLRVPDNDNRLWCLTSTVLNWTSHSRTPHLIHASRAQVDARPVLDNPPNMISGAVLAVLAGVALAYLIHQKITESLDCNARAKKLGCRPPVADTCDDPVGISGTLLCIRAHSDNRFLDIAQQRIRSLQERIRRPLKTVALRTLFFRDIVITFDPQNVQAILALKSKDFVLGVNRTGNFKPLLGANGIVGRNSSRPFLSHPC